jgi:hypothetical protein
MLRERTFLFAALLCALVTFGSMSSPSTTTEAEDCGNNLMNPETGTCETPPRSQGCRTDSGPNYFLDPHGTVQKRGGELQVCLNGSWTVVDAVTSAREVEPQAGQLFCSSKRCYVSFGSQVNGVLQGGKRTTAGPGVWNLSVQ